jgi:hypothetical protein
LTPPPAGRRRRATTFITCTAPLQEVLPTHQTPLRARGAPKIKQYHKEGRALRTETTINDTGDLTIGKRLTNLPALREVGFSANRRLLGVQRLSHNPIRAAEAFTAVHQPIVTDDGRRIAGLRLGDRCAHAVLQALLIFRLLPNGFRNQDLRGLLVDLLGRHTDDISPGQVSYDLRRLRAHGLTNRIPGSPRPGGGHPPALPAGTGPGPPSRPIGGRRPDPRPGHAGRG